MKNTYRYGTDIVIVGGGISGIYIAQKCIEHGLSVVLLEKNQKLGGRIQTVYGDGYQYESGAGRFSENHELLRKLIRRYNLTEVTNSKRYQFNGKPSPVQDILKKLTKRVANLPRVTLESMTFKHLCEMYLGVDETRYLIAAFGYNAEFEIANAYTALKMFTRDFLSHNYYSCREGLSALVHRMERHIHKHALVYKNTLVNHVEEKNTHCVVHATDGNGLKRKYMCKAVVYAVAKSDLIAMKQFTEKQHALIDNVAPVSLHRIYGQFPAQPKPWFSNVFRTATTDPIRQFIPVNKKAGVAMMSYSDTKYADLWKKHAEKGNEHLKKEVLKHLHAVFPNVQHIPDPAWVHSHYWQSGVHLWKPGADVDAIIPRIQHISARTFVVGEAFSQIQGWIEGALESVEAIAPAILELCEKSC